MAIMIILICSCAVLVALLILVTISKAKKIQNPPGPHGLPLVGQGFSLQMNSAHMQFTKWCKDYGDIYSFSMFGRNVVVISHPEIMRGLFDTKDETANDRPSSFIGQYIADSYNDILFRIYDDVCQKLKSATIKAFHAVENDPGTMKENQLAEINDFIKQIASNEDDIDITEALRPTLCKILGLWFTGQRLPDDDPMLQAILDFDRDGNEMIVPATHLVLKLVPMMRFMPGYYGDLYRRTTRSKAAVKKHFLVAMKVDYVKERRHCLLHELFEMQTTESWLTDDLILGVILDLINTSTLTSRGVLSGLLFLLVHFQEVQKRIMKEIDNVIGRDRSPLTNDIQNMPYTHACIMETLRYQSHLALTATHTNSKDIELEGYNIPKGSSIYGNLWSIHHDERFWQDPYVFQPERFLQEDGSLLPMGHESRRMYYMPFGVGNRSCLGVKTTYNRMFLFCTALLQKHKLLPPSTRPLPSHDPRELIPGTVLQMPNFLCRLSAR